MSHFPKRTQNSWCCTLLLLPFLKKISVKMNDKSLSGIVSYCCVKYFVGMYALPAPFQYSQTFAELFLYHTIKAVAPRCVWRGLILTRGGGWCVGWSERKNECPLRPPPLPLPSPVNLPHSSLPTSPPSPPPCQQAFSRSLLAHRVASPRPAHQRFKHFLPHTRDLLVAMTTAGHPGHNFDLWIIY